MNIIVLQSTKIATLNTINSPDKVAEVKLACHLHLVPRLRINAAVHMVCAITN